MIIGVIAEIPIYLINYAFIIRKYFYFEKELASNNNYIILILNIIIFSKYIT